MKTYIWFFHLFFSALCLTPIRTYILHAQIQNIEFYKNKFDKYLHLPHQLDNLVTFYKDKITIKNKQGQEELTIYKNEIPVISQLLEAEPPETIEKFFRTKKNNPLSQRTLDSLLISIEEVYSFNKKNHLPLSGIRIAIDAGHFANDLPTAKIEQRLLCLTYPHKNKKDTIKLIEGQLTYLTAVILADKLKEQGADILLTRKNIDHTAFGMSYNEWYKKRKNTVLDSLYTHNKLPKDKYEKLKTATPTSFFHLFFREYELMQRAHLINTFNPHLTIIIHYNVDEKNKPWKQPTPHNYSICFIGGAFEDNDLEKWTNKIHFLRLLLTHQIENSEKISQWTIQHFEEKLNISPAQKNHAKYLNTVCIPTQKTGVFCRNLLLTRYILSPLVYGESLCQDNETECHLLSEKNYTYKNQKIPYRIYEVADAYFQSVMNYFQEILSTQKPSSNK